MSSRLRRRGGSWMDGYTTTACFFSWLTGPSVYHTQHRADSDLNLGYELNKVLGEGGADAVPGFLQEKFGENVDTLWQQYQDDI